MKMTTRTKKLIEALKDIRSRLTANENMSRAKIATAHRQARKGYKGHWAGREWNDSVIRFAE